jgi:phage terminase large subunit|tara:strand:+ start:1676 stop:2944 length:1269 start_codon:yes stop_codon:yes gene_type:complete
MPNIVIPYRPRELQNFLHKKIDKNRFNVLVLHRRAGKTVMMINHMLRSALTNPLPNSRYAFLSPTFKQGKATAWDYIKTYAGKIPGTKFNESELRCDLPNGSRITILGAENDQALRGIFLDGCVFDETQSIKPTIFPEIIRPALADRKGWCVFIGTPKGRNYFYELHQKAKENKDWYTCVFKASETKILDEEELKAAQAVMSEDLYSQEFECSFQAAITGSYFGSIIEDLEKQSRICDVPHDDNLDVETYWDLGLNDSTSIWFAQRYKGEIRLIDYYENSGYGLDHYSNILDQKGYEYSKHIAPHDIKVREIGNLGKSRLESALELGISFEVAPKISIEDGIEAVRKALPNCWFDKSKCKDAIEYLKAYQKRWDDRNQCFKNKPLHNYASHCADSLRTGIIGYGAEISNWKENIPVNTNYIV